MRPQNLNESPANEQNPLIEPRLNSGGNYMFPYGCVNCAQGVGRFAYVWIGVTVCADCHQTIISSA